MFARLRKEAPVHYLSDSVNGPFWSVTSHALIKEVDANNSVFSSEKGGISIVDLVGKDSTGQKFYCDGRTRTPTNEVPSRIGSPKNLVEPEPLIRERVTYEKSACRRNLQLGPGSIDRAYGENANHDFGLSL